MSKETSSLPVVSTVMSLVNTQSVLMSIGADLQLLSLIVADVTEELVFMLKVTLSPTLTVFPGIT
jgi:hypothetical protein